MPRKRKSSLFRFPAWVPEWIKLWLRVAMRLAIFGCIIFIVVAIFYAILASQYNLDKVAQIPDQNIILSDDGNKLANLDGYGRRLITRDEINSFTEDALIAREDTRFRQHSGIDLRGLVRATCKNISGLKLKEGASTITMQLVKNTYGNKAKSLHRKLLEMALTLRVESRYSKDEILTHYLNRIYFGSGCYGIEEAAQTYFGTTTKDLTLSQSALLIGIIRGPHIFSPFNSLPRAIAQRNQVLKRMVSLGMISQQQADDAIRAPLGLVKPSGRNSGSNYAVNAVIRHYKQTIDSSLITEGGLKVTSTINAAKLKQITADIKRLLPPIASETHKPLQAAAVLIENSTGAVRALVGGRNPRKYPYNRALDSHQQLGAAFYPFLYLAALERHKLPIRNKPVVTGKQIGYTDLLKFCARYGISHKPAKLADDLYRGVIYASPLQLANAYSILQNNGNRAESYFIESIHSKDGTALFTHSDIQKPVASAGNTTSCLDLIDSKHHNTKSISATSYKHLWLIVSNKKYTAVLWLGHDLPANIPNKKHLSKSFLAAMQHWVK